MSWRPGDRAEWTAKRPPPRTHDGRRLAAPPIRQLKSREDRVVRTSADRRIENGTGMSDNLSDERTRSTNAQIGALGQSAAGVSVVNGDCETSVIRRSRQIARSGTNPADLGQPAPPSTASKCLHASFVAATSQHHVSSSLRITRSTLHCVHHCTPCVRNNA